jgi:hypothetical protein
MSPGTDLEASLPTKSGLLDGLLPSILVFKCFASDTWKRSTDVSSCFIRERVVDMCVFQHSILINLPIFLLSFFFFFSVLKIKSRALYMLDQHSTTELHPRPQLLFCYD